VSPYALSTAPGLAEFNFVPNLPEESGLKERKYYNAPPAPFEKIPVKVARLDDVLPEGAPVRFVKMDVEGGERDVLLGAPRLLDRCRPIVAFECGAASFLGYHDAPEEIYRMFATRGYRVYSITGEWIQDEAQFRAASYRQAYWDYVAFAEGDHALAALLKPA